VRSTGAFWNSRGTARKGRKGAHIMLVPITSQAAGRANAQLGKCLPVAFAVAAAERPSRLQHWLTRNARRQPISPKNMKPAITNGWSNGLSSGPCRPRLIVLNVILLRERRGIRAGSRRGQRSKMGGAVVTR
jgi:hypothetical protein